MRILVVASLFPNPAQPLHGLFVARRVAALAKLADVRVVSPIPYFPGAATLRRYRYRRAIPSSWAFEGVPVHYPRFLSVPGLLKRLDAGALGRSVARALERGLRPFQPDAIDANLGWPDGAGVLPLARRLGVPCGVTLRGVEVNELPEIDPDGRGAAIRGVLRAADAVFPVSDALRETAIALGADPRRAITVPNGVDGRTFRPRDRAEARRACGLPERGRLILSCGHLSPRKRFDALVDALGRLVARGGHDDVRLAIVGGPGAEGDVGDELRAMVRRCGLARRVILAGARPPEELARWYAAADVFALASRLEGRPNVVIEALSCGIPVVACRVWGIPELVREGRSGILVARGTVDELADALAAALARTWDAGEIAGLANVSSWEGAARALAGHYTDLLRERREAATVRRASAA